MVISVPCSFTIKACVSKHCSLVSSVFFEVHTVFFFPPAPLLNIMFLRFSVVECDCSYSFSLLNTIEYVPIYISFLLLMNISHVSSF